MAVGRHLYSALCWHGTAAGADLFDMHVAGCILGLATQEARLERRGLSALTGLDKHDLPELFRLLFPDALDTLRRFPPSPVLVDPEEAALRDILWMYTAQASAFERLLARMIARRAMRPNHLWQDLGFASRRELTMLMQRHFPRLAARNRDDMKWKKFFYRMMCSSTGFSLCSAPVCTDCDDFDACFGSEDGDSILARVRRDDELRTGA